MVEITAVHVAKLCELCGENLVTVPLLQGFVESPDSILRVFRRYSLTIDDSTTVDQRIVDYRRYHTSRDINSRFFPVSGSGRRGISLVLVHLNPRVTFEQALEEIKKLDLRPATIHELLAFGVAFPKDAWRFVLIALGSLITSSNGVKAAPSFYWYSYEFDEPNTQFVDFLGSTSNCCAEKVRFLAVAE
ncbi:MAG: hypothetical protein V1848_03115 [Candidatus Magasanikbacteria bacterium]